MRRIAAGLVLFTGIAVLCLLAAAGLSPALAAGSYQFDGQFTFIDHGDPPELRLTDAVSVCAWVKSSNSARQQLIAGKSANANHIDPYLEYGLSQSSSPTNSITFGLASGGEGSLMLAESDALADITGWNWVCGAWDRTLESGLLHIYFNGREASSYISQPSAVLPIMAGLQTFRVGGTAAADEIWDGNIAYVHVWNRRISAAEAGEVMRRPGSRRRGLVLYSPMTTTIGFPRTPILDDFNRPNGLIGEIDPSTTNWTHSWSLFDPNDVIITIDGNEARSVQGDINGGAETWNKLKAKNLETYVTLTSLQRPNTCNNMPMRHPAVNNSNLDMYSCEFCHNRVDICLNDDGVFSVLASSTLPAPGLQAGDQLGQRIVGNTMECYINGELIASATDGTLPGPGYVTLFITNSSSSRMDDFGGGIYNGIRDLSGLGHHTTAGGLIFSPDGPPVAGGAR